MFVEVPRERFTTERNKLSFKDLICKLQTQKMAIEAAEYCWFARDVTAAMVAVKNKSILLLWELNSIFM